MSTRSKEEQQLLDEKIARIQKKNEEILRRRKEVEEDKRLAEQQNAVVKLRPSSATTDRERTPALKPSRRELRNDFSDENYEPVASERSSRGGYRGRGGGVERYRGQGDWKVTGPPPDPRSFLYDDERDTPQKDRDEKGDGRRDLNRRRREMEREEYRGGREFERGNQRGGSEHRVERGRRGGRGGFTRNQEEAWREERMRIDEARIQRQKAADGKWRREWDNEKLELQEPPEEARHETRRTNSFKDEPRRPPNHYHREEHKSQEDSHHGIYQESPSKSRGRGRGRLPPAELEMPLENIPLDIFKKQISPGRKSGSELSFADELQKPKKLADAPSSLSSLYDSKKLDTTRKIERVGESFKISILNSDAAQPIPKPQRQVNENRARIRSQPSYSSQSDEDSPRDRGSRGHRRPRSHKYQRGQGKPETSAIERILALPAESKPPLPPSKSKINEDDDGSWEDVTTSGTESLGEELLSTHSTPIKATIDSDPTTVEPSDHQFDKYLEKVDVFATNESSESGIRALDKEDTVLEHEAGKDNKEDDCISLEASYVISSSDISLDGTASSNTVGSSQTSTETRDITASSTNHSEEKHAADNETEPEAGTSDKEEAKISPEETKTEISDTLNTGEIIVDSSIDKTSLNKDKEIQPTKLHADEENTASQKEIGNNSEINCENSVPRDD